MKRSIRATNAIGPEAMEILPAESICATNELARHGAFAPVQWVLAKLPRQPATLGDESYELMLVRFEHILTALLLFALQSRN